jgi:hypothetical protein
MVEAHEASTSSWEEPDAIGAAFSSDEAIAAEGEGDRRWGPESASVGFSVAVSVWLAVELIAFSARSPTERSMYEMALF